MYSQEITRRHGSAMVIVLDRSGSMQEQMSYGHTQTTKAEILARTASSLVTELIDRCRRTDALRDYYDVAVIGYGNNEVEMLLGSEGFLSVVELDRHQPPYSIQAFEELLPNGEWAMVEHQYIEWFKPKAEGNTPMYEAMLRVRDLVSDWCSDEHNRESFPPIVINITDGESSDCDDRELCDVCSQIRRTATEDGNTLLLNIHISSNNTIPSMIFPMAEELATADHYARTLAECSSIMPDVFNQAICQMKGAGATPPFFGMGYNASIIELLSIINIGSRSVSNMQ
jgi:hypothetical protein